MKADKKAADRGELVSLMEPLLIGDGSRHRGEITDLALELSQKAAGFRRSLPPSLLASLADLVRSMNCYYSNLIEGHDTHPVDIERALKNDYSKDASKRDRDCPDRRRKLATLDPHRLRGSDSLGKRFLSDGGSHRKTVFVPN